MSRFLNFAISLILLLLLFPLLIVIGIIIKLSSPGPILHNSSRVGVNNKLFQMPKFRSMRTDTPQVATHLLQSPERFITPIGKILRATSLDELPQLLSILKGDMNFVGPRPALFNQDDLIALRTASNVHTLTPGVTGWAQINGRDSLSIEKKVELDSYYLNNKSIILDIKIIILTVFKVLKSESVSH